MVKNEKSAQRGSFWDGHPADIRGHSCGYPGPKLRSGRSKSWKKNKHFGADIHDPKARTSTTLRDFQKLRSEKLWAEFSLSIWGVPLKKSALFFFGVSLFSNKARIGESFGIFCYAGSRLVVLPHPRGWLLWKAELLYLEGPARHLNASRQKKLTPHCLAAILYLQKPSPNLSLKMPPKLLLPHKRGHFLPFQNCPLVRVIARQLSGKNCLAAVLALRHLDASPGPLGSERERLCWRLNIPFQDLASEYVALIALPL